MSAQKTLSQLLLAAVVLLVVAIPSFAQTETRAGNMTGDSSVVAVNHERVTRESRPEANSASDVDTKTKLPKLSADLFVKAASESSSVAPKPSFEPIAMPDRFERKQGPVNGVTFILSRGQKLPE